MSIRKSFQIPAFSLLSILCLPALLQSAGTRNPWTWPFSRYSIWNMPIGGKAAFTAVNMPVPTTYAGDVNYIHVNSSANPRTVSGAGGGILPVDDGQWVNTGNSENKVLTVFDRDSAHFHSVQPGDRSSTTGNFNGYIWGGGIERYTGMLTAEQRGAVQSLYGMGIEGAHWGSGMSGFGGTIRATELTNATPIRHALAVEVSGWVVLNNDPSDSKWDINAGDFTQWAFRWPADRSDACSGFFNNGSNNTCYFGTIAALRMGALLAIPPTVNIDALGLSTNAAKKLAWTLQNYGGYVVDDAYGMNSNSNIFNLCYEQGVNEEFKASYGYDFDIFWSTGAPRNQPFFKDLDKIIPKLAVVSNNGPRSIGGGGNPCQCYAPAFSNGKTDEVAANPNGNVQEPGGCNGSAVVPPAGKPQTNPAGKITGMRTVDMRGRTVAVGPLQLRNPRFSSVNRAARTVMARDGISSVLVTVR